MTQQKKKKFYTKVETYKWFTKVGSVEPLEDESPDLDDRGLVDTVETHHNEPMQPFEFVSLLHAEIDHHVEEHMGFSVPFEDIRPLGDNVYQVDYLTPEGEWTLHVKAYVTTFKIQEYVSYASMEEQLFQ